VEYGFSTMGYEIAGGVGVKMAAPDREVYVLVGDGSYLMMAQELVTAVQERIKIVVIVVDNHGYASIGGVSRSLGSQGFGTQYRDRRATRSRSTSRQMPRASARSRSACGRSPSCAPRWPRRSERTACASSRS